MHRLNFNHHPNSVTYIGCDALSKTEWYNNQPDGLIYINNVLYEYKGTMPAGTSIEVKEGIIAITEYAFEDCTGLTSITIPSGVTSIGWGAFDGCTGLTSITIPSGVTSIENSTFEGCSSLTSITIPSSVTSIGQDAFGGCTGLTSITIPSGVTSIGNSTFKGCSSLTSITIPSSVTRIADDAFSGTAWYNNQPDGPIYAGNVLYKYKGTMPPDTSIEIKEGTVSISKNAFYGCTGLTSITIPSSVTCIESNAFQGCTKLVTAKFENPNGWFRANNASATSGAGVTTLTADFTQANANVLKNIGVWNLLRKDA